MEQDIRQLIDAGELAREKGNYAEALSSFEQAIILSVKAANPGLVVDVLGHKLLVYRHLFDQTQDRTYLDLMYGDVQTGLNLAERHQIPDEQKAIMLFRAGDYYMQTGDSGTAVQKFEEAVRILPEESFSGTKAEFNGHYGLALVLSGNKEGGFKVLQDALELIDSDEDLRPFHKLVVQSGVHMRLAEAYARAMDEANAQIHIEKARQIAVALDSEHKMPMRKIQVENLAKELAI